MNYKAKAYTVYILIFIALILAAVENIVFSSISNSSNAGIQEITYNFITKISSSREFKFIVSPFVSLLIANLILFYKKRGSIYMGFIPLFILISNFIYEIVLFNKMNSLDLVADINIGVLRMTYISWSGKGVLNHSILSPNLFYSLSSLAIFLINQVWYRSSIKLQTTV